jgi:hypothetical protein
MDHADPDVVIVLTASPGINVQGGSSGVEITRFESPAPGMPDPHIQSGAELHYAGIAAAARVPNIVKCNRRLSELAEKIPYPPWCSDSGVRRCGARGFGYVRC